MRSACLLAVTLLITVGCAPASAGARPATRVGRRLPGGRVAHPLQAGTLTFATSEPAYEPWMVDDEPESTARDSSWRSPYAVADRLGFAKDAVAWKRVQLRRALNNQSGPWDFDINQFTITDERKQAVDFSSGYYDLTQTVIAVKSSPIERRQRWPSSSGQARCHGRHHQPQRDHHEIPPRASPACSSRTTTPSWR